MRALRVAVFLAAAAAAAGCGAGGNLPSGPDAPQTSDANPGDAPSQCSVFITFDPATPASGPTAQVRAIANVFDAPGVLSYTWHVDYMGAPLDGSLANASPDGSQVFFPIALDGLYHASLEVDGSALSCPTAQADLNVTPTGAHTSLLRLHVSPAPNLSAPPMERIVVVSGGASQTVGQIDLDVGTTAAPLVTGPSGGIAAYVRFWPTASPGAVVEAFSDMTGHLSARLQAGAPHTVLVVPSVPGVAPKRITGWVPGTPTLALDAGTQISGTVLGPNNLPLGGAAVQLAIDGVPSTLTTTDASGNFTVRAELVAGAQVTVDAAAAGLPRLTATAAFPLAAATPVQVRFAAELQNQRSLAGAVVRRGGTPLAGAAVQIVGAIPSAGTITVGATSVAATGTLRIATATSTDGSLGAQLVPEHALFVVTNAGPGDYAVTAVDFTASVPASIDAPAPIAAPTSATDANANGLGGAVLEAVPVGTLALANAPTVQLAAGAGGALALSLAAGGHYDLRFRDPAGRGAPLVAADRTAATVAAAYALPAALRISGTLAVNGNPGVTAGASVQVLCEQCSGVERSRPLAEVAVDGTGAFSLAVPDPGVGP